jgi:hypothetical protein
MDKSRISLARKILNPFRNNIAPEDKECHPLMLPKNE